MQPPGAALDGAILMLMKADTVSTSSASQRQTLARPLVLVAGSSVCKCVIQRKICNLLLYTPPIEPLAAIFFNSCQSCLIHHHTFTLLPRATRLFLPPAPHHICKEPGAWGASQHCFEVERLKGKDLSNWDDGAKVGRGGGSVRGTEKAVNTESLGSPRDIIKNKAFL